MRVSKNKEVESLSGKSIKYFAFTLSLNLKLNLSINPEYIRETNYNNSRLLQIIQDEYRLNPEQKNVYDVLVSSINSNEGKAARGTGERSLIHLLLAKVRFNRKIALAVALSGIAVTLLEGG